MDEPIVAAQSAGPAGDDLQFKIDERTTARFVALAQATGSTVESLLNDALDFYLDGCGA